VINVAGHRLSTGEIEEVDRHPSCGGECAVIARDDEIKGQTPMGMVVLKTGAAITDTDLQQQLIKLVRDNIGALTCYKDTVILARLPQDTFGKTLRKTLCRSSRTEIHRAIHHRRYGRDPGNHRRATTHANNCVK